MNSSGLSTEPWCTQTLTLNALLSLPFILTFVEASSYIAFITDTIHSSTAKYLNAHQTTSRSTLSNAFSKSTKNILSSSFFARYFSCSWRTMKIASVVPLPAINPNCMLSIFTMCLNLPSITFQNLHCMLQQLYAPVWATCQCITLSFVNIHHPTPTPILWHFTIFPNSITHLSHPQRTSSARSPEHFCHNPCRTRSLAWLHLSNCHFRNWNPLAKPKHRTYIGQTISVPSKLLIWYLIIICSPDFHQLIFLNHNLSIIIHHTARTYYISVLTY